MVLAMLSRSESDAGEQLAGVASANNFLIGNLSLANATGNMMCKNKKSRSNFPLGL